MDEEDYLTITIFLLTALIVFKWLLSLFKGGG